MTSIRLPTCRNKRSSALCTRSMEAPYSPQFEIIRNNIYDVESSEVTMASSKKTRIQWLVSKEDGANNFALRRFKIGVGGEIGLHHHKEEHEIDIGSGKGVTFTEEEKEQLKNDSHAGWWETSIMMIINPDLVKDSYKDLEPYILTRWQRMRNKL